MLYIIASSTESCAEYFNVLQLRHGVLDPIHLVFRQIYAKPFFESLDSLRLCFANLHNLGLAPHVPLHGAVDEHELAGDFVIFGRVIRAQNKLHDDHRRLLESRGLTGVIVDSVEVGLQTLNIMKRVERIPWLVRAIAILIDPELLARCLWDAFVGEADLLCP